MAKTRRQRGSGSVRKRGQALYLRYRPPGQARQVEQSFPRLEGETMPAYRQRAHDELIKVTQGLAARTRRAPTARTLETLADSYLASLHPDVKARTHESYESFIRSYILPVLGSRKVSRLTTEDIRSFQQQLLHHQVAGDRTMAVSTARVTMSRLHDMLNYALDGEDSRDYWGLSFDPWPRRRFRWPDERQKPAPCTYAPYDLEETRRFLAAVPADFRPHFLCVLLLMLRDGELRAMRWEHLDTEAGCYAVCQTHGRKHGFTTTKTASSQAEIPVPRLLLDELAQHRKHQAQMRLKKGDRWHDLGLIFATSKGTAIYHNWYVKSLKDEIAQRAGIRPVSLHTLRKTGASLLEGLGVSRAETQVALRHKRPSVTDVYVTVYMDQRRQHIEQLADLITVPPPSQASMHAG